MTSLNGTVIDSGTREPVPGATISINQGNLRLAEKAADGNGNFSISSPYDADSVTISAIGFGSRTWKLPDFAGLFAWELTRSIPVLPEAVVTTKKTKNLLLFGGLALLALFAIRRKQ